jgi:hypothetical protein
MKGTSRALLLTVTVVVLLFMLVGRAYAFKGPLNGTCSNGCPANGPTTTNLYEPTR